MRSPQHLPCAKNARSMHDTVCHAWSNAHEHHILTTSVTAKASREHKDMYKRRIVCSKRKPQDAPRGIHCGKENIENSMTKPAYRKTQSCRHIEARRARLLLLLTAGRTPVQLLFHKEKEGLRTDAGLRKHKYRSQVHVRSSAAEGSRLASRAKSEASEGIAGRGAGRRTAYVVNHPTIDQDLEALGQEHRANLSVLTCLRISEKPVAPASIFFMYLRDKYEARALRFW